MKKKTVKRAFIFRDLNLLQNIHRLVDAFQIIILIRISNFLRVMQHGMVTQSTFYLINVNLIAKRALRNKESKKIKKESTKEYERGIYYRYCEDFQIK